MDFGSLKCCNFGKIRTEWVLADSFITTKQLFSSHTQEIQVCASQPRGNSRVPPYTDQFPHQCPWKTLPPPVCPWTPELSFTLPRKYIWVFTQESLFWWNWVLVSQACGKRRGVHTVVWVGCSLMNNSAFLSGAQALQQANHEKLRGTVFKLRQTQGLGLWWETEPPWGSLPVTEVLRALTCTELQSPFLSSGEHEWGAI